MAPSCVSVYPALILMPAWTGPVWDPLPRARALTCGRERVHECFQAIAGVRCPRWPGRAGRWRNCAHCALLRRRELEVVARQCQAELAALERQQRFLTQRALLLEQAIAVREVQVGPGGGARRRRCAVGCKSDATLPLRTPASIRSSCWASTACLRARPRPSCSPWCTSSGTMPQDQRQAAQARGRTSHRHNRLRRWTRLLHRRRRRASSSRRSRRHWPFPACVSPAVPPTSAARALSRRPGPQLQRGHLLPPPPPPSWCSRRLALRMPSRAASPRLRPLPSPRQARPR